MIGRETVLLDPPRPPGPDLFAGYRYALVADGALDRGGRLVRGEVLAVSRHYDGALRALRHVGPVARRVAIRKIG